MEKTNYEWLISKLRKAETDRDAAIEHAKMVELDNLRLRIKLRSISDYAGDEPNIEDLLSEDEGDCPCIPEEKTDKSGIPFA